MKQSTIAMLLAAALLPANALAQSVPPKPVEPPASDKFIVGPAYYVTDMGRSLHFYRDVLGMTVRMQFGPKDRPDAVLGFGANPMLPSIMLLSDREEQGPRKVEHAHGYNRIAIHVSDMKAIEAALHEAGYKTTEVRRVHDTVLMMMATDPDGYAVELVSAAPPAPAR